MLLGEPGAPAPPPEDGGSPTAMGPSSPTSAAAPGKGAGAGDDFQMRPEVQELLSSEIGVITMLNRLKQSIASAKEFSIFLKKRSELEEDHANRLRKLCKMTQDSLSRPDQHRGGTFATAFDDMLSIHERMADNGAQFGQSLHQMNEDLAELAAMAEKSRKGWKQNGLTAEQRVADLEAAMRKSKAKYDALAEEYDRIRTGDPAGGGNKGAKMFGIRGPKSAHQHEEDLLRKAQAADQDYAAKVLAVQTERGQLIAKTRPETVKALQEVTRECDLGLALQMQKFATFSEKLLLSNGLSISPFKAGGGEAKSLRECVLAIDNEKDINNYLLSQHAKLPPRRGEPVYERNPLIDAHRISGPPQTPTYSGPSSGTNPRASVAYNPESPASPQAPGGQQLTTRFGHSYGQSVGTLPILPSAQQQQQPSSGTQQERRFSHGGNTLLGNNGGGRPESQPQPQLTQQQQLVVSQASRFGGPPQLGALPFQQSPVSQIRPEAEPPYQSQQPPPPSQSLQPYLQQAPHIQTQIPASSFGGYGQAPPPSQQQRQPSPPQAQGFQGYGSGPLSGPRPRSNGGGGPYMPGSAGALSPTTAIAGGGGGGGGGGGFGSGGPSSMAAPQAAPSRPVFGVSLNRLYERDGQAVPMVVYQCIQAADLYGLGVEGIYRLSGSVPHVNKLKNLFDTDSSSNNLDFRNPENFFHDVNSVAGLLKQFFRDLPDPLLTKEHYSGFIEAAKHEDDVIRRDSLHAIINNLPDPNYATLRALTLHLHRVTEHSSANRMSSQNLAIVFGPTVMGTGPGSNIADAGWQVRVVDTILQNTMQIFDDDD